MKINYVKEFIRPKICFHYVKRMPRRGVATAHAAGSSAATAYWPFQGGVIMSETSGSISGLTDEEARNSIRFTCRA